MAFLLFLIRRYTFKVAAMTSTPLAGCPPSASRACDVICSLYYALQFLIHINIRTGTLKNLCSRFEAKAKPPLRTPLQQIHMHLAFFAATAKKARCIWICCTGNAVIHLPSAPASTVAACPADSRCNVTYDVNRLTVRPSVMTYMTLYVH